MISRDPEGTVYGQIARHLREQITTGVLVAGAPVGSEKALAHDYQVGISTVRRALAMLRDEGLVVGEQGQIARVREPAQEREQPVPRVSRITGRRATAQERRDMGLPPGASVFVVTTGAKVKVIPQDGVTLTIA